MSTDNTEFIPVVNKRSAKQQSRNTDCNVYVNKLPITMTAEQLKTMCAGFGAIQSVRLFDQKNKDGKYGFVAFATSEQANTAVSGLNNQEAGADGTKIFASIHKTKEQLTQQRQQQQKPRQTSDAANTESTSGNTSTQSKRGGRGGMRRRNFRRDNNTVDNDRLRSQSPIKRMRVPRSQDVQETQATQSVVEQETVTVGVWKVPAASLEKAKIDTLIETEQKVHEEREKNRKPRETREPFKPQFVNNPPCAEWECSTCEKPSFRLMCMKCKSMRPSSHVVSVTREAREARKKTDIKKVVAPQVQSAPNKVDDKSKGKK